VEFEWRCCTVEFQGKFEESYVIDGFKSRSRFGQALASLGDINQDGYGDFAVGAPYDGKGAVYIYHGSAKGVRKKYSQVILAEDIVPQPSRAPQTFGFSLTGGLDLDGNQYPDMAVGAYLSNKAFFFRSRPVIRVAASVKFLTSHKTVDIRKPDYYLSDGTGAVKTQIQFCSNYSGKGIPASLNLGVEYILDTKKLINSRMGFVDDENQNRKNTTITLYRGVEIKCADPVDVYVRVSSSDSVV
jgi:integrin alpha 8